VAGVLELGRAGTAGADKGVLPVLRDGSRVGTLRASAWREGATAEVGGRSLVFGRSGRELTGRNAGTDAPRFRARLTSPWTGVWSLELDGTAVAMRTTSWWRGTRRYTAGDRIVAESASTGWLRRPTLTAAEDVALETQVFLLWVELVILRRAGGAAAGAAVVGGAAAAGAAG
jgi:hypothetical protein